MCGNLAKLIFPSSETRLVQNGRGGKRGRLIEVDSESCTGGNHTRSSDLAKLNPKCHMNYSNYL